LEANGKVILINPNGVIFSKGSRVDVGAIVASSLKLSDENFLKDNFVFEKDGIAGIVENRGTIKAFEGGTVALISSIVKNNGTIETPNGSTALLAGEKVTLNLNYNQLISYTIDSGTLNGLVENNNAIVANNGQVILSARGLDAVRKSVVNTDGIIEAKGINTEGGKIFLEGDEITVKSNSTLNASGDNGGGQILVGGSWQNSDPTIYQATTTTIEEGATLNASANNTGNGGEIVVWSDITNDQSVTKVQGKLTAEGGKNSGNGGQIETSGYKLDVEGIEVSTLSNNGTAGEWLLDPGGITISTAGSDSIPGGSGPTGVTNISPNTILTGLASNNVSIFTGLSGSTEYAIEINDSIEYTGANDRTLTFKATGTVRGAANNSANTGDVNITSTNAALNLVLWSDADGDGDGKVVTPDGNITTNGGHFWAGGGDGSTTWNGLTVGDDYASTPGDDLYGVRFRGGTTLNTGSGNIKISGRDNGDHSTGKAVSLGQSDGVSITSTGNIEIFATSDSSQAGDVAFETNSGTTINVNGGTSKALTISIATGAADVSGDITGTGNFTKSGAGDLTLSGTNTYTGDTTISTGTLELTGSLSTSSDLIVSSGATFDLQATQTVASLDLDGTISRSSGTSALTVSGTSDIGGNITTSGNQVYSGAISLTGNSILTSSSGTITLSSTVDGGSTLTTSSSGNLTTSGIIGGTTPLTSLSATAGGNISYVNNITTTGAISLNAEGNVDPNPSSGDITLSTTNSDVTLNADSEGNGTGTFYGNLIINPGSGNVTIRGATIANESYQVNGTGTLTIESNAASFASAFTSSALTEASTLTGLTIGKSTNTSDITLNSDIAIAGSITVYGGGISLNNNITNFICFQYFFIRTR
jgi:autotransporter-associated beta strand protein